MSSETYKRGYIDGMTCFAWHHPDGHQEVGTTGTRLKDAVEKVETLFNYAPPQRDMGVIKLPAIKLDVDKIPSQNMTYAGDGVYALFDGFSIWLHANDHKNPTDVICLEPFTLNCIIRFAKQFFKTVEKS